MSTPSVIVTTPADLRAMMQQTVAQALAEWTPPTAPGPLDHLPELLDRKQAAELLSITLPTLDSWARSGKIQKYHMDGLVRLRKSELIAGLKNLAKYRHSGPGSPS